MKWCLVGEELSVHRFHGKWIPPPPLEQPEMIRIMRGMVAVEVEVAVVVLLNLVEDLDFLALLPLIRLRLGFNRRRI